LPAKVWWPAPSASPLAAAVHWQPYWFRSVRLFCVCQAPEARFCCIRIDRAIEEYEILLSTGGPALRIYGTLNQYEG
jgi:hypothetical protein